MVYLTCKNHTHLRWTCKPQAISDTGGYNHARSIFFLGAGTSFDDMKPARECDCSPDLLTLAPGETYNPEAAFQNSTTMKEAI